MRERYDELRRQAEQAFTTGDLSSSVELYLAAEQLAERHGEHDLADYSFCSRCAVLIELDEAADQIPKLKQIYLRSRDTRNRWLAAYYSAVAYDLEDEVDRARSYAQRAMELAPELDDAAITARCANLAGTLALRSSSFDEAEAAFEDCIEAHADLDGYHRSYEALAYDNLGYVHLCTDRVEQGLELCEKARRSLEEQDSELCLPQTCQDLCYGYLLVDDLERAQRCGEQALDLAVEHSDELIAKNCLFLLSEVAIRRGDTFHARRYLRELTSHYPEVAVSEEIIDVFLATDLTTVVNLRG